ncbi:hypothetical protein F5Y19DRAFT_471810 [Xylariaceae sp. FL1651]|nr:hypothetical protein F5Y19DRAFT_471810 [Xylariaceae sp. FL1651]
METNDESRLTASTSHQSLQQQQQLSVTQHAAPRRQFTTVGSIYNPQPQPLQPPVRRGRTAKSLFPHKNESPTGPTQLKYTPLQQNADRAVSPVRLNVYSMPSTLTITNRERQVLQKFGVAVPNITHTTNMLTSRQSPSPTSVMTAQGNLHEASTNTAAVADTDSDDDSIEEDDIKQILNMNIKSLTNLASYPNLMQRAAQKVLSAHRPQPTSADDLNLPTLHANLRNTRSDPVTMARLLHSDSINENHSVARLSMLHPEAATWTQSPMTPTYMPALPRISGAPAPLTAGPPGMRQFKSINLDSNSGTSQNTLQRSREFDDDNPVMNPYSVRPQVRRPSSTSFKSDSSSSACVILSTNNVNTRVVDTLPDEEAITFYPRGLPSNFNHRTQSVSLGRELEYSNGTFLVQAQEQFWAARRLKIDNDFYSGNDMINKTFALAVSEKNRRNVARAIGGICMEPANKHSRITNRRISIAEASQIPASEHAAPLLCMAFQAMASRPEMSPYTKLPKFEHSLFPAYLKK